MSPLDGDDGALDCGDPRISQARAANELRAQKARRRPLFRAKQAAHAATVWQVEQQLADFGVDAVLQRLAQVGYTRDDLKVAGGRDDQIAVLIERDVRSKYLSRIIAGRQRRRGGHRDELAREQHLGAGEGRIVGNVGVDQTVDVDQVGPARGVVEGARGDRLQRVAVVDLRVARAGDRPLQVARAHDATTVSPATTVDVFLTISAWLIGASTGSVPDKRLREFCAAGVSVTPGVSTGRTR